MKCIYNCACGAIKLVDNKLTVDSARCMKCL